MLSVIIILVFSVDQSKPSLAWGDKTKRDFCA